MALSTIFANLPTGNNPASLIDTNMNQLGAMAVTSCTATGTNTIALAPNSNQPNVTSYTNYGLFSFVAAATSTGSVTANVNSVGALPVYLPDGTTQATTNNIFTGCQYIIQFNQALNSATGGFVIMNNSKTNVTAGSYTNTSITVGVDGRITSASTGVATLSSVTNSLSGDVTLNNTATYFDGPSAAQGTSGTWLAFGTVTMTDTAGNANFQAKLWDGTTVIASAANQSLQANAPVTIPLSGVLASPAANIRISVKDVTSTSGKILFNTTGNSKDSTITVVRIA